MPWCHHCKTEYRDGFQTCSDCGGALLGYPPEKPVVQRVEYGGDPVEPALVYSTRDRVEADTVEALLRGEGLLVYRRYTGGGQYMTYATGQSNSDIDLYVHPDRLEDAQAALEAMTESPERIPDDELQDESGSRTLRRLRSWVLIVIFLFTLIVAASGQIAAFFRLLIDMFRQ